MSSPRLDRRALLWFLVPGALFGVAMAAWLLSMTLSTSSAILWGLGALGAVALVLGFSACGALAGLAHQGLTTSLREARAFGWSPRLFGIIPATIGVLTVPVLVIESDLLVRVVTWAISLLVGSMALIVASAWIRWRYAKSFA